MRLVSLMASATVALTLNGCGKPTVESNAQGDERVDIVEGINPSRPHLKGFSSDAAGNVVIELGLENAKGWPVKPVIVVDDDGLATLAVVHYLLVQDQPVARHHAKLDANTHFATIQSQPVANWEYAGGIYVHAFQRSINWLESQNGKDEELTALKTGYAPIAAKLKAGQTPTYGDVNELGAAIKISGRKHSYQMTTSSMTSDDAMTYSQSLLKADTSNPLAMALGSFDLDLTKTPGSKSGVVEIQVDWAKAKASYEAAIAK